MTKRETTKMTAELLTPHDAAVFLGFSEKTLSRMRMNGSGPRFVKATDTQQGQVRYSRAALLRWIRERERASTSDTQGGTK